MARTIRYQLLGGLSVVLATFFAYSSVAAASTGSSNRVRAELRQADEALGHVWQEAGDDEDAEDIYDLDAVAANLAHTEAARQLAMKVRRSRATMLADVNDQADENVYEYADDASWAPAEQQPALAAALLTSASLRSSVTAAMLVKAEKLTPGVRASVLRSITDALSDGDPDILLEALSEEDGATEATTATLVETLKKILADSHGTLDDLERLSRGLDRAERDKVDRAIGEIEDSLDELPDWVDELIADIADYADDPEAAAQSFCGLLASLPLPAPTACG